MFPSSQPPPSVVDAIRGRIAPLFPDWSASETEALVRQMAALEWKYQIRDHEMQLPSIARRTQKG